MPMQVGLVGLPNSGKTTLFNALTHAGAEVTAYASVSEKANVGVATIPDERLEDVSRVVGSKKMTPAAIRVMDVPGTGGALLGGLRQSDALLVVADGFSEDASPERDVEAIRLELLVADRDHVERRLEKVRKEAKSGDPMRRQEVETLERLLAHLDAGNTLLDWPGELPPELEPLTTKPLITVINGPDGIDCKLELELADMPPDEAAEFRDGPSALDQVVNHLKDALGLIVFFTAGDTESRSWTLRQGQNALEAAESIHTDIARGFIRCEVIRWDDLVETGSHAEAARRGLQRLEGKTYVVEDGDVINIRFNV
jgi:ribosome-binding ATPase YchF (GTP1/OBG family)